MRWLTGGVLLLLVCSGLVSAAQPNTTTTPNATPSNATISNATPPNATLNASTDGLAGVVQDAIGATLVDLVKWIADRLSGLVATLYAQYPDVRRPDVLVIHSQVFTVAAVLATAAIVWTGVLHLLDRIDGIRRVVAILVAVGFGAVAPELLWYPVELSRLTTEALLPAAPEFDLALKFSLQLLLVALIDVILLLGIGVIFIGRNVLLLLGIALAPLLALLAVTPGFRRYAWLLANAWVASLLIGPLNAVVYDLTLTLLASSHPLPDWLWALGGLVLMFGLPVAVLGIATVMLGPGLGLARQGTSTVRRQTGRTRSWLRQRWGSNAPPARQATGQGDRASQGDRDNRFTWGDRR